MTYFRIGGLDCQTGQGSKDLIRTVRASTSANAMMETTREQIFHANRTAVLSYRSGQNKSKKNAAPKIVATAMPTKMLYEAIPMKSSL